MFPEPDRRNTSQSDFHPNNKGQRADEIMMFSGVTGEYAKNSDQAVPYKESGTSIHGGYILVINPTRFTNFSNLFWNKTLHVSDSSSVQYQEFYTVHTAMFYVIQVC